MLAKNRRSLRRLVFNIYASPQNTTLRRGYLSWEYPNLTLQHSSVDVRHLFHDQIAFSQILRGFGRIRLVQLSITIEGVTRIAADVDSLMHQASLWRVDLVPLLPVGGTWVILRQLTRTTLGELSLIECDS